MKTYINQIMREPSEHEFDKASCSDELTTLPTMNTLQLLIEQKALTRLQIDYNSMRNTIARFALLKETKHFELRVQCRKFKGHYQEYGWGWDKMTNQTVREYLLDNSERWEEIKKAHLPLYIEEETNNLLKTVESLNEQVGNLNYEITNLSR